MDNKKIISELKNLLENKISLKIKKIYLFGSQVTNGNVKDYSDYDILILLENDYDWKLEEKIYDISYDVMLKYNIVLDIKIISVKELKTLRGKQPFIQNAIKSGVYA